MDEAYAKLLARTRDVARLGSIGALLEWDQETYMPPGGVEARAEQTALIAGIAHERLVADETRSVLEQAKIDNDDPFAQANLRETRRMYDRAAKVPNTLVQQIAHASSIAKDAWAKARSETRFDLFAPHLKRMVDLKRQLADHVGFTTERYDALLDEFEPGASAANIETLFNELRGRTVDLLRRIEGAPRRPDPSILERHFPKPQQEAWSKRMAESLGFDFQRGRNDVSVHPFCTTIGGSGDVRITTRYLENFLPASVFGTLHETGHALYEQGLPAEHRSTPLGEAVSMGIHESQSRLWENLIGRSRAFWVFHYDDLRKAFSDSLRDVSLEAFHGAINAVRPSFIRVEADELTYNLHIILRFSIERRLMRGELEVGQVPEAWNESCADLLGIRPPDDRQGCLQDIHWSMGAFGYFPTYTLGNLYAAQFYDQARRDIPDLTQRTERNDHQPLREWLREKIYRHGKRYRAHELVEHVTGKPLSIEPFIRYITDKLATIYGQ